MKVYQDDDSKIIQTQYHDPLLNHLTQKIIDDLMLAEGKKLLDIGCGVGRVCFLAAKKGFSITGIDIEKKAIDLARKNAKRLGIAASCTFITGDILKQQSLSNGTFDVIICSEVIEHVSDPKKIINFAFNKLKKGGLLILTTPHDQKLWSVLDEYAGHVKRFSLDEVKKLLSNFEIMQLYTVGFPCMRFTILLYNFMVKSIKLQHNATWRRQGIKNYLYGFLIGLLLKFDDLFNTFSHGTNIIAVAKK